MNISSNFEPVPTRAALALRKRNKSSEFKALVFEEPKGPKKLSENVVVQTKAPRKLPKDEKDELEFDIKRARHEVLRFATANQRLSKNKKKMEIFQAIKLGAKPPKKPYKNYKVLLDERKRLNEIREQRKKFHQLGKNQTGAASVKCRSKTKIEKQKKRRAPVSSIDQHYGIAKPNLKKKK